MLRTSARLLRLGSLLVGLMAALPSPSQADAQTGEAEWYDGRWPQEHHALAPHPKAIFGRLDNGFRYVIFPNGKPAGRTRLSLNMQVGSLMEEQPERGIAHYLEHMAFNGSRHFPAGSLIPFLQEHAMQFGADANAHTAFTETVFDLDLTAKSGADLDSGLLFLRDIADGLSLDQHEVDRERGVILSEKSARSSDRSRLSRKSVEAMFAGTKFANDIIGIDETINAIDAPALRRFYTTWYRPDRMVLIAVGDLDPAILQSRIAAQFSGIAPRKDAAPTGWWGDVHHQGVSARHEKTATEGFSVSVTALHSRQRRPDSLAEQRRQIADMLGREIFQRRLQAKTAVTAPFVGARYAGSRQIFNLFPSASLSASCETSKAIACLTALGQELESALAYGFTDEELATARGFLRTRFEATLKDSADRQNKEISTAIIAAINADEVFQSEEQAREFVLPTLERIDRAEVERSFRAAWDSGNRLIASSGDVDLGADPSTLLIKAWQDGEKQAAPYQGVAAQGRFPYLAEPEKPLDAAPAIERRLAGSELTERRIELSNGLTLRLLPTPFDKGQFSLTLLYGRGLDSLSARDHLTALVSAQVLRDSGLGKLDREAQRQAFGGKPIRVGEGYRDDAFTISASGDRDQQDLLLTALWTQFSDPQPRDEARQRVLSSLRIGRNDRLNTLDNATKTAVEHVLFGDARRSTQLDDDAAASVSLDDMRRLLADIRQQGPRTLIAVGDFDPDALAGRAALLFASVPPAQALDAPARPAPRFPAGQTSRSEVPGVTGKANLVLAWRADNPDENDQRPLAARRLLAEVLNDRLREKVREEMGASYSPTARYRSDATLGGYGFYLMTITTDRAHLDQVRAAAKAVANTLAAAALPPGTAEKARATALSGGDAARQQNRYWLRLIEQECLRGKPVSDWSAAQTAALRAATDDDLEAAAKALADAPAEIIVEETPTKVTAQ